MEKNLDITKPLYGEQILPVPWPFIISRFHYMPYIYQLRVVMQAYQSPLYTYVVFVFANGQTLLVF